MACRFLLALSLFSAAAAGTVFCFWQILPQYADDPLVLLSRHTPARSYYDREGSLIKRKRTSHALWRLDLPLSGISPEAVKVILGAEDANFYKHKGVDLSAVARAFFQNVTSGRIVSGASTISMQLASLAMREKHLFRKRSLTGKIRQTLMARKLEMCHDKEEILKEYLNRIPFGGPIAGIGAASLYYFGLPADKLNLAESSLLCGLPQRPNRYRPDRNLSLARKRQKRVLQMLERKGLLKKGEAENICKNAPLRLRDFSRRSALAGDGGVLHNLFIDQAEKELRKKEKVLPDMIHTALDQHRTKNTLEILRSYVSAFENVHDAAAVVIDNRKMQFLVYIGTLDFTDPLAGQVDAASAVRSAGSTLKPFIYAEAVNGGLISKDTFFMDAPLKYKDYEPGNYDGKFYGKVTVEKALQMSLNTTAVKMLELLGENRVQELFSRLDLPHSANRKNGLSLALGSAGYTLKALTNAFTVFPNRGIFQKATFLAGENRNRKTRIWTEGTIVMLNEILIRNTPPFGEISAFWKTGTSNGYHDAWCLAATPEYTVGVWMGNKTGKASIDLVGIRIAAPCAAEILKKLYEKGSYPNQKMDAKGKLSTEKLCTESGLKFTSFCSGHFYGRTVRDIPLQSCTQCQNSNTKSSLRILSPSEGNYILPPGKDFLEIPLKADQKEVFFFADGEFLGKKGHCRKFSEGRHTICVMDPSGLKKAESITFHVIKKQRSFSRQEQK